MKTENKNYRIIVLLAGLIFYYIFFSTYWSDEYWYLDEIDTSYSFVNQLVYNLLNKLFFLLPNALYDLIEGLVLLIVHLGYFYFLWSCREDIVVLIKKLFNKI